MYVGIGIGIGAAGVPDILRKHPYGLLQEALASGPHRLRPWAVRTFLRTCCAGAWTVDWPDCDLHVCMRLHNCVVV